MKLDILSGLLVLLTFVAAYHIYSQSDYMNLRCVISDVDGNRYCVRERSKITKAADRLAEVNKNMSKLVAYLREKYPKRTNVIRLVNGYNPRKIYETLPTSTYTAYSENKGEKLAFCLNAQKNDDALIDLNTLTFVAIHELAHIATKSIGHTDEFWDNFKFLLQEAVSINIYKPVDYSKKPQPYCGSSIHDSPLYDMDN
jgi:hypothetical protein